MLAIGIRPKLGQILVVGGSPGFLGWVFLFLLGVHDFNKLGVYYPSGPPCTPMSITFVQFSNITFWRKNDQDFWHEAKMLQKHLPGLILFVACVWPLDIFTFAGFWLPQSMCVDIMVMLDGDKIGKKILTFELGHFWQFPLYFRKMSGENCTHLGCKSVCSSG